jgi:hypothetical protein
VENTAASGRPVNYTLVARVGDSTDTYKKFTLVQNDPNRATIGMNYTFDYEVTDVNYN